MAYRTAVHNSTKFTPARLMKGHELRVPIDLTYGFPEEDRPESLSEHVQNLQHSLEEVHEFTRKHLEKFTATWKLGITSIRMLMP